MPAFLHFLREHQLNNFRIRIPLLLGRTSVNVERRPTACVSQQFLSYFDVDAQCSQIRRPRLTEAVPTDLLADDTCQYSCKPNTLLKQTIRAEGFVAFEPNRREKETRIRRVKRLRPPIEEGV